MDLGKIIRRVLLMLGLTTTIWAPTLRAADNAPAPANSETSPAKGQMAFLEYFKTSVDGLKLGDEAQQKAEGFFTAARKQLAATEKLGDKAAVKRAAHEVFEKLRFDISTLLSDEQKIAIRKKLQSANSSVMIERIKSQLSKPELHLSDEQREKVSAVLEDTKHKLEELRAEAPKDAKARVEDVLKEMKEQLGQILSPQPARKDDSGK